MLSDSVMEALGEACRARDRYYEKGLRVRLDPTMLLGIETQIAIFAATAKDWYEMQTEREMQSRAARTMREDSQCTTK